MNKVLVTKEKQKISYNPQHKPVHSRTARAQEKISSSPQQRLAGHPGESLLLCVLIFLLVTVSIGLIAQYSRVIAVNYQLQQVNRDIAQLQEEKEHLAIEVRSLSSLERIESIAVNELGLQYPEQKQWLRLSARGN